jgi:predicted MFS family arabinose efflux permease
MVAEVFVGASAGLIFSLVTTVMVELLPRRSASLVALNSLGRNLFATVGSGIGQLIISAIGTGWACTTAAILVSTNLIVIALIRTFGKQWREKFQHGQET